MLAGALLWAGVARCPPASVVSVRCWRVTLSGGGLCGRAGFFRRPFSGGAYRGVCSGRCSVARVVPWVWPPVRAWWAGVVVSHGCGPVSFLFGARGGLIGLGRRSAFLSLVLWCALVCRAVLCCALLGCVALLRAVLCCASLCHAVPCHVVPCPTLPCCGVLRLAVPCRAVPCRVAPCGGVPCRVAVRRRVVCCDALCCVALCCAAPCYAVPCCAVGQSHPLVRCGVAAALVRLAALLCGSRGRRAGLGYLFGWWLVGVV